MGSTREEIKEATVVHRSQVFGGWESENSRCLGVSWNRLDVCVYLCLPLALEVQHMNIWCATVPHSTGKIESSWMDDFCNPIDQRSLSDLEWIQHLQFITRARFQSVEAYTNGAVLDRTSLSLQLLSLLGQQRPWGGWSCWLEAVGPQSWGIWLWVHHP